MGYGSSITIVGSSLGGIGLKRHDQHAVEDSSYALVGGTKR